MEKSEIETIYRKYFHDVFLYIRALSENESLAEEITQETFLKAMNNIEKFDGRKDIRAWLFVIAKNTYFRYCRRNKIYVGEEFSEIMQDSMQDTSPAVLDQIVQDETVRNLKRYAELIPEPYREVFHLRIYGELSFEQIGKCYQKSAGWARVTCHRARQMIEHRRVRRKSNMEKIKCNVIQDILPLYIDDVVSDDTKELVEEHLQNCEICQRVYHETKTDLENDMKVSVQTKESSNEANDLKNFRKFLKKRKIKTILLSIAATIVCFVAVFMFMNKHVTYISYKDEGILLLRIIKMK